MSISRAMISHVESGLVKELRARRKRLRITQADLAKRIGVTQTCIMLWENEINYPRDFERWQTWASALGARFVVSLPPVEIRATEPEFALAKRLHIERLLKKREAKDIARALDVTHVALYKWESFDTKPMSLTRWRDWAALLGLDMIAKVEDADSDEK